MNNLKHKIKPGDIVRLIEGRGTNYNIRFGNYMLVKKRHDKFEGWVCAPMCEYQTTVEQPWWFYEMDLEVDIFLTEVYRNGTKDTNT